MGARWNKETTALFIKLYPISTSDELKEHFPERSQNALHVYARKQGIQKTEESRERSHEQAGEKRTGDNNPNRKEYRSPAERERRSAAAKERFINEPLLASKMSNGMKLYIERNYEKNFQNAVKGHSTIAKRGGRTSIELAIESELTSRGVNYTPQKRYKLGVADIFIEPNIYVFADGDYWHAYDAVMGRAEPSEKQASQIAKDVRQTDYLETNGNIVLRFWEHEIKADVESCIDLVLAEINELEAIS